MLSRLGISQNRIDLLWQFTKTSFKMRYQNSLLGVLWVLIKPYATFAVMYFVWSKIGRQSLAFYPQYLLLGIVLYTYLNELLKFGNAALLDKAHIILKVNFSRQVAVVSSLFSAIINLGINLIFVFLIFLVTGIPLSIGGMVYMLFVVGIMFIFGMGITFFISIINVRFRDLENIVDLGMFLLYWATPVFIVIDPELLGSTAARVLSANPVGILINQVRAGFGVYGTVNPGLMVAYLAVAIFIFWTGWRFFSRRIKKVAEYF